jgi:hypothetical protein
VSHEADLLAAVPGVLARHHGPPRTPRDASELARWLELAGEPSAAARVRNLRPFALRALTRWAQTRLTDDAAGTDRQWQEEGVAP